MNNYNIVKLLNIELKSFPQSIPERKKYYKTLIKKYHPDLNNGEEIYNKCLIIINNKYSNLSTIPRTAQFKYNCKYSQYIVGGKYQLRQTNGAIINISDKEYFIFRLGYEYIMSAQDLMLYNSGNTHNKNQITLEASGKLYKAFACFNDVIKMNSGSDWYYESKEKLKWAYKINKRITRCFIDLSNEKTLSIY